MIKAAREPFVAIPFDSNRHRRKMQHGIKEPAKVLSTKRWCRIARRHCAYQWHSRRETKPPAQWVDRARVGVVWGATCGTRWDRLRVKWNRRWQWWKYFPFDLIEIIVVWKTATVAYLFSAWAWRVQA